MTNTKRQQAGAAPAAPKVYTLKKLPARLRTSIFEYAELLRKRGVLQVKLQGCDAVFGNASAQQSASKGVQAVLDQLEGVLPLLDKEISRAKAAVQLSVRKHMAESGLAIDAKVELECRELDKLILDDDLNDKGSTYRTVKRVFKVKGFAIQSAVSKERLVLQVFGAVPDARGRYHDKTSDKVSEFRLEDGAQVTVL